MKKLLLTFAAAIAIIMPVLVMAPTPAGAADPFSSSNAKDQACAGISGTTTGGTCTTSGKSVSDLVKTILNFLSAIIGIIAVIMVITAGYKYVTAAGDSSKISGAKSTLISAIVGVVIVAMAQFIVQFVINKTIAPYKPIVTTKK